MEILVRLKKRGRYGLQCCFMDSFDLILVHVDFVEYGTDIFFLGEVLYQASSGLLDDILGYWLCFFREGVRFDHLPS